MNSVGNQNGFTLLEMLISAAVFVIVLFAIYLMLVTNQVTYARGENKLEIQQNARIAVEMITRDVRMAGYDPSDAIPVQATSSAIQVATANTITSIGDVTGDDVSDQVTYRLQGTQVIRDFASWNGATFPAPVPEQLADGVSALTFTYFDGSDPNNEIAAPVPAASLSDIRRITIGITAQGTAAGVQDTFPLTIDVRMRNTD